MHRSTLAVVAVAAVVFAGCGGGGPDNREKVSTFVKTVNAVQERSTPSFNRANRAYVSFSKGNLGAAKAKTELAAAELAMRRTRDDIATIHAPAEAGRLKQLLVDFYDADASLAHESTLLAEFVPASTAALQPLTSTGRSLTRELRAATTAAAQEKALERYRTRVARVVAALQPLHPPPLLLNRHHQEIDHLGKVRSLAQQIVTALRGRDSARVSRLLARFKTLNSRSSTGALPRDAMTAYNKRYLGVRKAFQAVQRERLRLERTL